MFAKEVMEIGFPADFHDRKARHLFLAAAQAEYVPGNDAHPFRSVYTGMAHGRPEIGQEDLFRSVLPYIREEGDLAFAPEQS